MFSKKKYERCKYCSRFLTDEQKAMNRTLCIDCAKNIISGIMKSFRIRAVLGVICIAAVFMFIHYMRLNAFEYGEGVLRVIRVPVVFGRYLTYRPAAFENIMNFTLAQQIMLAVLVFTAPFAKRVRFGMDGYQTFSTQNAPNASTSSHPMVFHGRGYSDRFGAWLSEMFLTIISGPYFFVHGLVTTARLMRYAGR